MMAESLPFSGPLGPLSGRELDAWYEDLQDILFSETKNMGLLQTAADKQGMQVGDLDSSSYLWTVDAVQSSLPISFTEEDVVALEAVVEQFPSEVLEFLNQGSQTNFNIQSAASEVVNVQYDIPPVGTDFQYDIPSEAIEVQPGIPSEATNVQHDIPSTSPRAMDGYHDIAVEVDSSCSSSPRSQTHTEDEDSSGSQSGTKRKRNSQPRGGKVRAKEQESEKQVSYLISENERLKGEIERLSAEVEKTRKALIERMVNLKKA